MGRQGMRPLPITDNSAGIRRQSGDTTQGNPSERASVSPVLVTPTPSSGMRSPSRRGRRAPSTRRDLRTVEQQAHTVARRVDMNRHRTFV